MPDFVGAPCTDGFIVPGVINMIIDGQFGSTGKGLIASKIAYDNGIDIAIASLSPNAGHTFYMPDGKKIVTHLLPVAGIIHKDAITYLSAGCVIDVDLLLKEIQDFGVKPENVRIHPRAAVVTPENREQDAKLTKIASTTSGTGAARADKILRNNPLAQGTPELREFIYDMTDDLDIALLRKKNIFLESGQGVGLGLNFGYDYPHCTSRDVLPANLMADIGIHPEYTGNICMSIRAHPIRVGNVVKDGQQIGFSGPVWDDQRELTWEELGQTPELTTVTKRVRRIFSWSNQQYDYALRRVKPSHIFLNFANYITDKDINTYTEAFKDYAKPDWLGYGPYACDVIDYSHKTLQRKADENSNR